MVVLPFGIICSGNPSGSVQFNSHLFLSPIGARTLKMPVPYPPPSVGAYTLAQSRMLGGSKDIDSDILRIQQQLAASHLIDVAFITS